MAAALSVSAACAKEMESSNNSRVLSIYKVLGWVSVERVTHHHVLQRHELVGRGEPQVAQGAQYRVAVDEQVLERIGGELHGHDVALARSFVAAQQSQVAAILRAALQQHLRQFVRIAQAEVHAVPGQR